MPRSKEGRTRKKIDPKALESAVSEILQAKLRVNEAAEKYNLSNSTVSRHYQSYLKLRINEEKPFVYDSDRNAVKKVFTYEQELKLVDYLKQSAIYHYGLTKKDTIKLAFQYAKALSEQPNSGTKLPKEWIEAEAAGEFWLRGFRKRHPSLSLRKPEATSLARATGFNKENVKKFYDNLKMVMDRHKFHANDIYNLDETGNSTVHVPPKIICAKGTKQIGSVTSGERGVNITMIACINAIGNSIPPMLIFPRVNFKEHMLIGAPNGSIGGANPSGWSNEGLFVDYLKHFIKHVKPNIEKPTLLILDNHETHISIEALDLAKENGVVMLSFPPHTSHKLQPLDRTVFGPYKTFYNDALNGWLLSNPGKPITIYDVAGVIGKAYNKAFTKENIENGFKISGIFPFNENIFKDDEFLSSFVTDRELIEQDKIPDKDQPGETSNYVRFISAASIESNPPSCSNLNLHSSSDYNQASDPVTPERIRPFPKAAARKKSTRERLPGRSRVLTDTPEKKQLEERKGKKMRKSITHSKRLFPAKKRKMNKNKKGVFNETSTSEDEEMRFMCSDAEDFDVNDLIEEHKQKIKEIQENLELETTIGESDYVLLKVMGKRKICYYVGQIVKKQGIFYEVKYLVKTGRNTFVLKNDTVYEIDEDDIICKLPSPIIAGNSERQKNMLTFPVNFSAYEMPMD